MSEATGILTPIQIRDKTIKDLRVRLENSGIKAEIKEVELRDEIDALKRELLAKDKIIAMLQREIASLTASNARLRPESGEARSDLEGLREETRRLRSIIDKNSSNSSKPPSTNGFRKVPNPREKSQRPSGGQKGHPGHRLQLPSNLDALVAKGVAEVRVVDHTSGGDEYISRWTIDARVRVIVTEHRFPKGAPLPKAMGNEVTYGDNIKAMTVLLSNEGIIAEERLSNLLAEFTEGAIHPSDATIESFLRQFSNSISGELEAIEKDLLSGMVLHVDDTSMRCAQTLIYGETGDKPILKTAEKTTFDATLRVYGNEFSSLFTVNPRKDKEGVDRDNVLPKYGGTLSHDHESKFYNYGTAHATCGDHLSRDLNGLSELENCPWAGRARVFIKGMNKHKKADLAKNKNKKACDARKFKEFSEQYDALLADGWVAHGALRENELGYKNLNAMLNRLHNYKDCYLLFMRDYKAPFTNNLAERDLRPSKTRQKVSGCFRSWEGLVTYAKTRSFIATAKKRRFNLLHSISRALRGIPVFAAQ
ncbi:MAG: transposase [Peptococcaceae bacterium]|jgi:hypothetical protein|nr:transposase [Peptococcaceae bacterium]